MESFYSIQGEGTHTGKPSYFIRLAGCDVNCHWCDVKDSWDIDENQFKTVKEIVKDVLKSPAEIIVITGGEPLMRHGQMAFIEMMEEFKYKDNIPSSITFETNGTQQLTDDFVDYVTNEDKHYVHTFISCSPKLWTVAGEKAEKAIKPDNLVEYNRVFKKFISDITSLG